jgi:TDG/mug DNA glycosylase family protein
VRVLTDVLAPGLDVVFAAPAVGECAADRGHYYAGPGNAFWHLLHESGLTPRLLLPDEDRTLPSYGVGLADVVRDRDEAEPYFDVDAFVARVSTYGPPWIGFNGKQVAQEVARALGLPRPQLGPTDWMIGRAEVFVLPSSSGANRRRDYDGRPSRLDWWTELAGYLR